MTFYNFNKNQLSPELHQSKRKMRQNKWLKENNIIYIS